MSTVSVIMPAYNCAQYINAAIDSVLNQTQPDLELIVIDDGSTDETKRIAQSAAAQDSRMILLSQPNSGKPSIAKNRGLAIARGEYICFLDADDLYAPNKVNISLDFLRRYPFANAVFHDVAFVNAAGIPYGRSYLRAVAFADKVLTTARPLGKTEFVCNSKALHFFMCTTITTIHTSSVFIRKSSLAKERFYFREDLAIGEDLDLWFRLVRSNTIAYIDQILSYYRQHSDSITKHKEKHIYDSVLSHIRNYRRSNTLLDTGQRRQYRKRIATDLSNIGYGFTLKGDRYRALLTYLWSMRWRLSLPALKGVARQFLYFGH